MGTLYITASGTDRMLVATVENDQISLAYPHAGRFDFVRCYRFASYCKARQFQMRKELWFDIRVSRALVGADPADVAQNIADCFSHVYRMSGPYGLRLQGMGWQSSART